MTTQPLPGLPHLHTDNIYCIGRNYAAHARELQNPIPDRPVVFTKPLASLTFDGRVTIPPFVKEAHFETELVIAIGKQGKNVSAEEASSFIAGYGLGIDVTARDIQQELKNKSHPWFLAKGLDSFAPVSSFVPSNKIRNIDDLTFFLEVNGERRQTGDPTLMLFPINELIVRISQYVTLYPGDLVFTGTPKGVGQLHDGDHLHGGLDSGLISFDVYIKAP